MFVSFLSGHGYALQPVFVKLPVATDRGFCTVPQGPTSLSSVWGPEVRQPPQIQRPSFQLPSKPLYNILNPGAELGPGPKSPQNH